MLIVNHLPESPANVDVYIQGKLERFSESDFFKQYQVKGINRILLTEFTSLIQSKLLSNHKLSNLTPDDRTFIRFSLEKNNAQIGNNYLVLPIVEKGQDSGEHGYKAPKLSTKSALIFKAKKVLNHLSYHSIQQLITKKELIFSNSVGNISDILSLKSELVSRYRFSRPNLTEQQIIESGVGIVWFEWVGYVDKNEKVQYLSH
ncbi:hypothetical protein SOPP22_04020 [Shewanella sp. OPT22]|nr:hypothetical protein SOPP22_04020 [Shewanella sp. OPT22]